MILEVVNSHDERGSVEVIDPIDEQLKPDIVRPDTTHARPVVCVECSRALLPEQVAMYEPSGVVCVECCNQEFFL